MIAHKSKAREWVKQDTYIRKRYIDNAWQVVQRAQVDQDKRVHIDDVVETRSQWVTMDIFDSEDCARAYAQKVNNYKVRSLCQK